MLGSKYHTELSVLCFSKKKKIFFFITPVFLQGGKPKRFGWGDRKNPVDTLLKTE